MDPKKHKPSESFTDPAVDMAFRIAELQRRAKCSGFTSQSDWEANKKFMDDLWGED